eukprot:scaffold19565_cov28-Attheya_sp.AAC.1
MDQYVGSGDAFAVGGRICSDLRSHCRGMIISWCFSWNGPRPSGCRLEPRAISPSISTFTSIGLLKQGLQDTFDTALTHSCG